jgi:hypothetical protein
MLHTIYSCFIMTLFTCLISACGTEAIKVAEECIESDLIAQCPPGTIPDFTASAASMCGVSGEIEVDLVSESGSVTGSCAGTGECRVICRFETPCECGVDRITEEGVFCVEDCVSSACGNGVCEIGEDNTSCPIDCAANCEPSTERCNGTDRQICATSGVWEQLACTEGSSCKELSSSLTECVEDRICGNMICESGEDVSSCPMDCGSECITGSERCNGTHREICDPMGSWEQIECPMEAPCMENNMGTICTCIPSIWYADTDTDGFGDVAQTLMACEQPMGYVSNRSDCNDGSNLIHPNATEICNDLTDNNCNDLLDCDDIACNESILCTEINCSDQQDNDADGQIDCEDSNCSDDPSCSESCTTYCQAYGEICAPPGFSTTECRTSCATFDDHTGDFPIYTGNTVSCRTLHLESVMMDNQDVFCERARPEDSNAYCQSQGTADCYTYCAMMTRYCPATFDTSNDCHQQCRDFAAENRTDINNGSIYQESLRCRLENLETVAVVNGLECEGAGAGPMGCPGVYRVNITYESTGTSVFDSLELRIGINSMIYWTNQNINNGYEFKLDFTPPRAMAMTVHQVSLQDRRTAEHWTHYTFDQLGSYTAYILTGSGRNVEVVSTMSIIVE